MPKKIKLAQPVAELCKGRSWVDSQMVLDIQQQIPGWNTGAAGMKVNDLSSLWPWANLRRALVLHCKMFIEQMEGAHGMGRLTNETDFMFWGPLRHMRPQTGMRTQEDTVDERKLVRLPGVVGFQATELDQPELVDFIFKGWFIAKTGFVNEEPLQLAS